MIKSRFDISYKKLSERNRDDNIRSRFIKSIADNIARGYLKNHPEFSFNELQSLALYGMYKASQSYNPSLGKYTSYATYYCKQVIKNYLQCKFNNPPSSIELHDNIGDSKSENENDILNKIEIEKILSTFNKRDRKIIEIFYFKSDNTADAAKQLKTTRFKVLRKVEHLLQVIRNKYADKYIY